MNVLSPVKKLEVWRCLANGERVRAGVLARNEQAIYFQYDAEYLASFANLSPFAMDADTRLQRAPLAPHNGLHGVFADSLPDGWGMLLMDRVFRQHSILPDQLTLMDRLAYVGERGSGALQYVPVSRYQSNSGDGQVDLTQLAAQAEAMYDGKAAEVLAHLAEAGSPGGARPKAHVYFLAGISHHVRTRPMAGYEPWIVKFTSASLALGHEEGVCEAVYLALAGRAGIDVPDWQLIPAPPSSAAVAWLALKRFDCAPTGGRYHLHSLCGLLGADFRLPSLDYEDVIKASQILCKSPAVGQSQFRRAVFNLFALNQDDHSKNWAFLQNDVGHWQPSPFYDVTFSPLPGGEHSTAFMGYGKNPPLKVLQQLAGQAGFASWARGREVIQEVVDALSDWDTQAANFGVSAENRKMIGDRLKDVLRLNAALLKA